MPMVAYSAWKCSQIFVVNSSAVSGDLVPTTKAINLLADQHVLSIHCARTDIPLMDSVLNSHLVNEDLSNEAFTWNASFRVSLKGMVKRENIPVFVQPLTYQLWKASSISKKQSIKGSGDCW